MDRVTFQKQIWQFNEMSSLIKTFYNNKIFHEYKKKYGFVGFKGDSIRFTKVLTKYSTEYNNATFVQSMCQKLSMDKKDMFALFSSKREKEKQKEMCEQFEQHDISKLDVQRMYRYMDKYSKDIEIDELEEEEEEGE